MLLTHFLPLCKHIQSTSHSHKQQISIIYAHFIMFTYVNCITTFHGFWNIKSAQICFLLQVISLKQRVMERQRHPGFRCCATWHSAAGSVFPPGLEVQWHYAEYSNLWAKQYSRTEACYMCFQWSDFKCRRHPAQRLHVGSQQTGVSYCRPHQSVLQRGPA